MRNCCYCTSDNPNRHRDFLLDCSLGHYFGRHDVGILRHLGLGYCRGGRSYHGLDQSARDARAERFQQENRQRSRPRFLLPKDECE